MNKRAATVTIRKAEESDFQSVFLLLAEFALFQKTPEKLVITAEQMKQEKDLFHCFVAEDNGQIVGFITFFPAYYSWSGKAIYVDDLYVTTSFRNKGIGTLLLNKVVQQAKEKGCRKVRWQVSGWNENAILFYQSIGAIVDDTERNCDLLLH